MAKAQKELFKAKGIYLLPNLLTTAGLFAGFYAIVGAMKGHFETAAIAIFIAMIADSLDGRVARLMGANSAFGVQYDSLSDMVSFGLAPALLLYGWALSGVDKIGWLAAFIYAAAVALRLARFNAEVDSSDKIYFKGLPCPIAAAMIASYVWLFDHSFAMTSGFAIFTAIIAIILGILMVSNIRYRSFKEVDIKGRQPFFSILIVIVFFVAITLDPPLVLFTLALVYVLSGPVITIMRIRKLRKKRAH